LERGIGDFACTKHKDGVYVALRVPLQSLSVERGMIVSGSAAEYIFKNDRLSISNLLSFARIRRKTTNTLAHFRDRRLCGRVL
jgi:hypothetical protein